jgi:two-component system nitrate/nitrite response regulator NarL
MNSSSVSDIETAVRYADALLHLPAYPAQEWCTAAARCIAGVTAEGVALTQLLRRSPAGVAVEATGAAAPREEGERGVHAVRALAEHLTLPPEPPGLPGRGFCGTEDQFSPIATVTSPSHAFAWAAAQRVLWCLIPLDGGDAGRIFRAALCREDGSALGAAEHILRAGMPLLARRVRAALGPDRPPRERWLSARELEVLERLVRGESIQTIASQLGRSPHTVHDYVKALHRKLGASTRAELIARAMGFAAIEPKPTAPARAR